MSFFYALFKLALLCLLIAGVILWHVIPSRRRVPLPLGLKGLPILGNALQIPKEFPEVLFAQQGDEYGPSLCF